MQSDEFQATQNCRSIANCTYNLRLFRLFRGNSSSLDKSSSATCNVVYTVVALLRKYHEEAEEEAVTSWRFSFHKYFTTFFRLLFIYCFNYFYFFFFMLFYADIYSHPHRTTPTTKELYPPPKKISDFKKTLDGQVLSTNFDRKPSIRYELHRDCAENNNKEDRTKETVSFETQYQPSVCTLKEGSMKKCTRIQCYFAKSFVKNHLSFLTRKENPKRACSLELKYKRLRYTAQGFTPVWMSPLACSQDLAD